MTDVPVLKSFSLISLNVVLLWTVQSDSAMNFNHLLVVFFISFLPIPLVSIVNHPWMGNRELWLGSNFLFIALSTYVFATSPKNNATLFLESQRVAILYHLVFNAVMYSKERFIKIAYPAYLSTITKLIADNLVIGSVSLLLIKITFILINFP